MKAAAARWSGSWVHMTLSSDSMIRSYVAVPRGEIGRPAGIDRPRLAGNRRCGGGVAVARCGFGLSGDVELGGELGARAHPELPVDLRDVPLHRLRTDEEGLSDLAIGEPGREQLGDALLGGREGVGLRRPTADAGPLRQRALREDVRAEAIEDLERLVERLARRALLAVTPSHRAECE